MCDANKPIALPVVAAERSIACSRRARSRSTIAAQAAPSGAIAVAHLRRCGGELHFLHLRTAHPDDTALRASICAASDFIFPYAEPDLESDSSLESVPPVGRRQRAVTKLRHRSDPSPTRPRRRLFHRFRNTAVPDRDAPPPAHAFAITQGDGSRHYAYCKLLAPAEVLLLISDHAHTSFYLEAVERVAGLATAAHSLSSASLVPEMCTTPSSSSDVRYFTNQRTGKVPDRRTRFPHMPASEHPRTSEWLTQCLRTLTAAPGQKLADEDLELNASLDDTDFGTFSGLPEPDSFDDAWCLPNPRGIAPPPPTPPAAALHAIADPTAVLRLPARALTNVLAALLDERRVAVVGECAGAVSRVVLALAALLSPFEWPHLLAPTIPRPHAFVLTAPFPYLVGVDHATLGDARQLPLDDLLVVHLDTGTLEPIGDCFPDLFRAFPRAARSRLERSLTRARAALLRLAPHELARAIAGQSPALHTPTAHHTRARRALRHAVPDRADDSPSHATARSRFAMLGVAHAGFVGAYGDPPSPVQDAPRTRAGTGAHTLLAAYVDKTASWPDETPRAARRRLRRDTAAEEERPDVQPWLVTNYCAPVSRAMAKLYAELVRDIDSEALGSEKRARKRRQRSFADRRARDPNPTRRHVSWNQAADAIVSPAARFARTQMYMQWAADADRDPTFGVERGSRRSHRRRLWAERGAAEDAPVDSALSEDEAGEPDWALHVTVHSGA